MSRRRQSRRAGPAAAPSGWRSIDRVPRSLRQQFPSPDHRPKTRCRLGRARSQCSRAPRPVQRRQHPFREVGTCDNAMATSEQAERQQLLHLLPGVARWNPRACGAALAHTQQYPQFHG